MTVVTHVHILVITMESMPPDTFMYSVSRSLFDTFLFALVSRISTDIRKTVRNISTVLYYDNL